VIRHNPLNVYVQDSKTKQFLIIKKTKYYILYIPFSTKYFQII